MRPRLLGRLGQPTEGKRSDGECPSWEAISCVEIVVGDGNALGRSGGAGGCKSAVGDVGQVRGQQHRNRIARGPSGSSRSSTGTPKSATGPRSSVVVRTAEGTATSNCRRACAGGSAGSIQ